MNENNINYEKMIIVTAWFAMRRSWAFMMKYIPRYNEVVRCASDLPTDSKFRKDNWWENGESISVIFNEYVKLRTGISVNSC